MKQDEKPRGTYIGGPDAAAIVGAHPWRTALDVALQLRGEVGPLEDNWSMRSGRVLERELLDDYGQRHGVRVVERNTFRAHPKYDWSGSHIDGLVRKVPRVLEAKTSQSDEGYGTEGTDEVPEYVHLQVTFYLPIWECDEADVIPLFRNRDRREYHIVRDRELEEMVYAECDEFWQRVMVHGELPPMNGSESCRAYLARKYPRDERPALVADPATEGLIAALREARGALAAAGRESASLEAQLKALIGDAAGIDSPLGRITWRSNKPAINTDWQTVARQLEPMVNTDEFKRLVISNTTEKPGARPFLVPRTWNKKEENDDE